MARVGPRNRAEMVAKPSLPRKPWDAANGPWGCRSHAKVGYGGHVNVLGEAGGVCAVVSNAWRRRVLVRGAEREARRGNRGGTSRRERNASRSPNVGTRAWMLRLWRAAERLERPSASRRSPTTGPGL